jgi:fructokinase
MSWWGCIEAGGTKFGVAAGRAEGRIDDRRRIPTGAPDATLAACIDHLRAIAHRHGPPVAIGIGAFGPLDLEPRSARYGRLLSTPKPGWSGVDLVRPFAEAFGVPVAIDTDVNAAALGEHRHGAGRGLDALAYVTVGTGIGGGLVIDGRPLHGALHPEIGHLRPRRPADDLDFVGVCPFHGDCFEGLASGPAIEARWGASLDRLPATHRAHALIADYLGQLCAQLVLAASPRRIILGGGVLGDFRMLPDIATSLQRWLGGYPAPIADDSGTPALLVPPALGDAAGLTGALVLARAAAG